MPLKVTPKPTFVATVKVPPVGDEIEVTFRYKTADQFVEWFDSAAADGKVVRYDHDMLDEVIADIQGLQTADGEPVPYVGASTLKEWAVRYPRLFVALYDTYSTEIFGPMGARTKN